MYLTIAAYARKYNLARSTVYRWIKQGKLKTVEVAKGKKRIEDK
jgi:excisionase family DNA binding protein